jgi:biopolymer transport protein TolR
MGMSSGGGDELNSEINVTPMVDVMLVLLIIFMITAPMMNTGVDIDLPVVPGKPLDDPEGKLVLSISNDRKLHLGGTLITWERLPEMLKGNVRVQKEKELYIEADKNLPYGVIVTAMATAKNNGVDRVMMLTDPSETIGLKELDQNIKP